MTALGRASRKANTARVALLAASVALFAAPPASAEMKSFAPVSKTRHALVFEIDGIAPDAVRTARAVLRYRAGKLRRRPLDANRVRQAAAGGRLRVPRSPASGRSRARSNRGAKARLAKGGRVQVVVAQAPSEQPPADPVPNQPAPADEPVADGPAPDVPAPAAPQAPNAAFPAPTGELHTVPSDVPAGCSSDATDEILSWIASVPDSATLQFAPGECYRIEGTLEIKSRNLAIDGNGATFKSLNAPTAQRALWRAWDSTVWLRNMTIVGSYANGGVHAEDLQWAHAIDLRGTRALVEDVSMSDVSGDCVYFGLGADRSSGIVRDSSCRRIGRNGVSVVAGDDILVERMTTDRIGYIAFDVEPNTAAGNGSQRVAFDSNTIGSYFMKAYTVIGNAPVSDQSFTNNRVVGQGLRVGIVNKSHRPQRLRIAGNSSDTPTDHNPLGIEGADDLSITGNTVPLSAGTMAQVSASCRVDVSGNAYPGGSQEASILAPAC